MLQRSKRLEGEDYKQYTWDLPSDVVGFIPTPSPSPGVSSDRQLKSEDFSLLLDPDNRGACMINYREVMNYPKTQLSPRMTATTSISKTSSPRFFMGTPCDAHFNAGYAAEPVQKTFLYTSPCAPQQCIMCGRSDVDIPSQNKNICKQCDSAFWLHVSCRFVFKFCKGCKNFFPLSEFKEKPDGTKCVRCRERVKNHYQQKKLSQQPLAPPRSHSLLKREISSAEETSLPLVKKRALSFANDVESSARSSSSDHSLFSPDTIRQDAELTRDENSSFIDSVCTSGRKPPKLQKYHNNEPAGSKGSYSELRKENRDTENLSFIQSTPMNKKIDFSLYSTSVMATPSTSSSDSSPINAVLNIQLAAQAPTTMKPFSPGEQTGALHCSKEDWQWDPDRNPLMRLASLLTSDETARKIA